MLKKLFKYCTNSKYRFYVNCSYGLHNKMKDEEYLEKLFYSCLNYKLDLKNPKSYNEKLQWLKLNDRNPDYTLMVDKYKVREYVSKMIGNQYIIPLLGVWDNIDEIDFQKLPNQFVIKCNHNSGLGMTICKDKSKANFNYILKKLKQGLKQDYYLKGREWPYKNVERKIIAEEYLIDKNNETIPDYKFYCFNGKVKIVMVNTDRGTKKGTKANYFDKDFNDLDIVWGYEKNKNRLEKPINYTKMIEIAETLSKDIIHCRIDLYNIEGKIYFGEITFYDGSGLSPFEDISWDYKLGELIHLPIDE